MKNKETYEKKKKIISKKYASIIADLTKETQYKEDLCLKYKYSERAIRMILSEISFYYPVIATSDRRGYRIATDEDDDINDVKHTVNELLSRCNQLKKRCKPLIAFLKGGEKDVTRKKDRNKNIFENK